MTSSAIEAKIGPHNGSLRGLPAHQRLGIPCGLGLLDESLVIQFENGTALERVDFLAAWLNQLPIDHNHATSDLQAAIPKHSLGEGPPKTLSKVGLDNLSSSQDASREGSLKAPVLCEKVSYPYGTPIRTEGHVIFHGSPGGRI
jgi:hypothetical protein